MWCTKPALLAACGAGADFKRSTSKELAMDILIDQAARAPRRALPALSRLTIVALAGLTLALVYTQVAFGGKFNPTLSIFGGLLLGAAALIATGRRWAPLLGSLLSAVVVAGNSGPVLYGLTHPAMFHLFAYMVVAVALALVGFAGGIAAVIQGYVAAGARAPRVAAPALAALAGVCAGALLIGSLGQGAAAAASPAALAGLPAMRTPGMRFERAELRARAGEAVALRFENPHEAPHSFDIDELDVHVPVAAGGQGLILFTPTAPATYTFYCNLPGHREAGMVGTLVVEP
jgi:uncharacterized cupredoxin-like copper-binding protein